MAPCLPISATYASSVSLHAQCRLTVCLVQQIATMAAIIHVCIATTNWFYLIMHTYTDNSAPSSQEITCRPESPVFHLLEGLDIVMCEGRMTDFHSLYLIRNDVKLDNIHLPLQGVIATTVVTQGKPCQWLACEDESQCLCLVLGVVVSSSLDESLILKVCGLVKSAGKHQMCSERLDITSEWGIPSSKERYSMICNVLE